MEETQRLDLTPPETDPNTQGRESSWTQNLESRVTDTTRVPSNTVTWRPASQLHDSQHQSEARRLQSYGAWASSDSVTDSSSPSTPPPRGSTLLSRSETTATTRPNSPASPLGRCWPSPQELQESDTCLDPDNVSLPVLRQFLDDLAAAESGDHSEREGVVSSAKVEALHKLVMAIYPPTLNERLALANQQTSARIRRLTYIWNIQNFTCIRDHASLSALPYLQNFIESETFGDDDAGRFYLMLFPYGESGKDLSGVVVKVVSNNKHSSTAKASFVVLNSRGQEVAWTKRTFDGYKWFQTSLYYNSLVLFSDSEAEELTSICSGDDSLRLKCELEVCVKIADSPKHSQLLLPKTIDHSAPIAFSQLMKEAWHRPLDEGQKLLDLRIICAHGGTERMYRANRFALAARSKVFKRMLTGGNFKESHEPSILVRDVNGDILYQGLEFIHTDSCPFLANYNTPIKSVCDLAEFADRYDCEALKMYCTQYLINSINNRTVLQLYSFAKAQRQSDLLEACLHYVHTTPHGTSLLKSAILDSMPWVKSLGAVPFDQPV